ncbi:toprim domain-containing protein [Lutimaribacter sp. EGI FJ00015]|uniref:Toprim domain-containing protein n=1 Tax=Lutimaribacter degradans TaxID=2945989 RepID=A0ACC5ZRJ9_9RHOB|nr:toprim domain-containing protein [Lutimaribacter sp. EGI FJ00013]MCM2560921.1 toprim domain-containing protein [Lutimaribacter sp. EGI FJ00013]MCO0612133.1 toprim domain-containing protein [Lutimaribacter sp. EGI FJ00015]MCO0634747.1 toprim domain-containing protein [Lutimaribacter sp. EGI FJ00014]
MSDARDLTQALGGKWYRSYGAAPCPVCQPQRKKGQNALTLADGRNGRLLLDCKKSGCAFLDILAAAGVRTGDYIPPDAATLAQREAEKRAEAQKRAAQAKQVWTEAKPIAGTVAETYLRGRGITCDLGQVLRFHDECWHGPTAKRYPAMVAAVQGASLPAVHRTYLRADGSGKADIDPGKLMLGAVAGGAVWLTEGPGPLVVAEGIETGLSLASGLLRTPATVWAALSTSGIRGLRLPAQPGRLTIAPDGDKAGREAANALAARAHALGWQVSLLPAPDGRDWNDIQMKGETA